MKYKFINANDYFLRDDADTSVLIIRKNADQFLLNKTGLKIFRYLEKNKDTDDVLKLMSNEYPMIKKETILNDILDIVNLLDIYNIIDCKNKDYTISDGMSALDEDNYELAEKFIERNRSDDFLISGSKGYYTSQNIRTNIMNNKEYYYNIAHNSKFNCILVINPNINGSSVINISSLIFDIKVKHEDRVKLAKKLLEYVISKMTFKVNKIRFTFLANNDTDPKFLKLFEDIGFKKEAILKKEFNNYDMHLYILCVD